MPDTKVYTVSLELPECEAVTPEGAVRQFWAQFVGDPSQWVYKVMLDNEPATYIDAAENRHIFSEEFADAMERGEA